MSEPQTQNQTHPDNKSLDKGIFYQLSIVVVAAIVLATLFTAWTPGILPNRNQDQPLPLKTQTIATPTINPTPTFQQQKLIGIVSGHWGNDSGAVCDDGLTEVEVNQTVATLVQKELVNLRYIVDILHEFDPKLTGYRASALVSIHADSCRYINEDATGFKVATALSRSNRESSTRLASCIRNRYAQVTGLPNHSTSLTPDMTDYHAFIEIDTNTPAVIIETGFLNLDRQFLTEQPDLVAKGIVNGILCFLENESISPPPSSDSQ